MEQAGDCIMPGVRVASGFRDALDAVSGRDDDGGGGGGGGGMRWLVDPPPTPTTPTPPPPPPPTTARLMAHPGAKASLRDALVACGVRVDDGDEEDVRVLEDRRSTREGVRTERGLDAPPSPSRAQAPARIVIAVGPEGGWTDRERASLIDEGGFEEFAIGAFYTLVPMRPRWRGERRSLRTLPVASLRPPLAFNPRPRRLSTPTDAFQLHPFNST